MAFIADFPLIHSAAFIRKEVINTYSLLYTVEGTTKGKLPYLLASHLDVVPVDPSTWEVPPFSGKIVNRTYIYGRGAIDDKSGVLVSRIIKDSSAWFDKSHRTAVDILFCFVLQQNLLHCVWQLKISFPFRYLCVTLILTLS